MRCFGFGRGVVSAVTARFIVICYLLFEFPMTSCQVRNAYPTDRLCQFLDKNLHKSCDRTRGRSQLKLWSLTAANFSNLVGNIQNSWWHGRPGQNNI